MKELDLLLRDTCDQHWPRRRHQRKRCFRAHYSSCRIPQLASYLLGRAAAPDAGLWKPAGSAARTVCGRAWRRDRSAPGATRRCRDRPCVELSILPCRWAGFTGGGFLLLCLAHGWQLQRHGALLPAAGCRIGRRCRCVGTVAAATGWVGAPCRLQLARGWAGCVSAAPEPRLRRLDQALTASGWAATVVLVLRRPGTRCLRLLLGPRNPVGAGPRCIAAAGCVGRRAAREQGRTTAVD